MNLASEPLEKVRTARRHVMIAATIVVGATVLHLLWWGWITEAPERDPAREIPLFDAATLADWSLEVGRLAAAAEQGRARQAAAAVAIGNQLIGWRTIPWRSIFADLEEVLPDRVRLEVVAPAIDGDGPVRVQMTAAARDPGPLQDFLIALESHASFRQVWPEREEPGPDGEARMTLRAYYVQADRDPAPPTGEREVGR